MSLWNEPDRERDDEALRRERGHAYGGVVDELPQRQYVGIAREVLSRFSVEQRRQLVAQLREQARAKDIDYPGLYALEGLENAETLAGIFGHMRMNEPGLLEQLLIDTSFYEPIFSAMDALARPDGAADLAQQSP